MITYFACLEVGKEDGCRSLLFLKRSSFSRRMEHSLLVFFPLLCKVVSKHSSLVPMLKLPVYVSPSVQVNSTYRHKKKELKNGH